MHILLFTAVKPSGGARLRDPVPPRTLYPGASVDAGIDQTVVRRIKSPAVFSMPSELGFSRELQQHDVQNRKTITPLPMRSEHFHEVGFSAFNNGANLDSDQLMIFAARRAPELPLRHGQGIPEMAAKRVKMAPGLMERLMGGIVLPADLNQPVEKPWTIHASITISEQGAVEHVFLDRPLEENSLNQQALQVLYSLRFKPGAALESSLEIYSPQTAVTPGGAK